jgi:ABC-type amino acid transport substrate-binding protein
MSGIHLGSLRFTALVVGLALMLAGCRTPAAQVTGPLDVATRVKAAGKLRAGYIPVEPAVMKDPNTGKLSGIFVETLEEIARRLDVKLEFTEEVGWDTMIAGLNSDRYDIVCAQIWPDAKRAREAAFTAPLYYIGVGVYTRVADHRFDKDLSKINSKDVRISMIDGSTADVIAGQDFPVATKVALPGSADSTQTYLEVATNKADVTFTYTSNAEKYIRKNPGSIRNLLPTNPLRVFSNTYLVKPGQYHFMTMVNTAIEELHGSGQIEKLIRKYEAVPGELLRVNQPFRPYNPNLLR